MDRRDADWIPVQPAPEDEARIIAAMRDAGVDIPEADIAMLARRLSRLAQLKSPAWFDTRRREPPTPDNPILWYRVEYDVAGAARVSGSLDCCYWIPLSTH